MSFSTSMRTTRRTSSSTDTVPVVSSSKSRRSTISARPWIQVSRQQSASLFARVHLANREGRLAPSDPNLPSIRVTRKPIPRGNSRLEIRTEDLMLPEEVKRYCQKPTLKSSVANVGLSSSAYWKRLLFNSYSDLYIVSRSPSPHTSPNSSPESSQHVSPSTTFPVDTPHPLQDPQV